MVDKGGGIAITLRSSVRRGERLCGEIRLGNCSRGVCVLEEGKEVER